MTAAQEIQIRQLAAEGLSQRAIGRRVRLSHVTVAKALARPPAAPSSVAAGLERPPPLAAPPAPAGDPAIDQVRQLLAESREQIDHARASGDTQLGQRATRNSAALASVLARLEKVESADSDLLKITRTEIDATYRGLQERVKAIVSRPLFCAGCSRALSVAWGHEPKGIKPP
jgi:hypothetical protein